MFIFYNPNIIAASVCLAGAVGSRFTANRLENKNGSKKLRRNVAGLKCLSSILGLTSSVSFLVFLQHQIGRTNIRFSGHKNIPFWIGNGFTISIMLWSHVYCLVSDDVSHNFGEFRNIVNEPEEEKSI